MLAAGSSFGSVCHCLTVMPRKNASYSGRPVSEMAFSSKFCASLVSISLACSAISARLVRRMGPAEELVDQRQVHRQWVNLPPVLAEHPVLVVREAGELVDVIPHAFVR